MQAPLMNSVPTGQAEHVPATHEPEQHCLSLPQGWPSGLHLAKAVPIPLRPSIPPTTVAPNVLSAWRREVGVARALVKSSNLVGSIFIHSFVEAIVPPPARDQPVPERQEPLPPPPRRSCPPHRPAPPSACHLLRTCCRRSYHPGRAGLVSASLSPRSLAA